MTEEDILAVEEWFLTLDSSDIPSVLNPPSPPHPLTPAVLAAVRNQLKSPTGAHTAYELVRLARESYNKRFTLEQMQYCIDSYWHRVAEIMAGG